MDKAQSLLDGEGKGQLVSPLVDVIFNLMITFFVFLMCYMAVVIPKEKKGIEFAPYPRESLTRASLIPLAAPAPRDASARDASETEGFPWRKLPPGNVYEPYVSQVTATLGSGSYTYLLGDAAARRDELDLADSPLAEACFVGGEPRHQDAENLVSQHKPGNAVIYLNHDNGRVRARFFDGLLEPGQNSRWVTFEVIAVDNKPGSAPEEKTVPREKGAPLFFYKQWGDLSELATGEESSTVGAAERRAGWVKAHWAVRSFFGVKVTAVAAEFDPENNPLDLVGPRKIEGTVGVPLTAHFGATGGIEPYQFDLQDVPQWLEIDPRTGLIEAKPTNPVSRTLTLRLKDNRFLGDDWHSAREAAGQPGRPYLERKVQLVVREPEPLEARLVLPRYSRIGDSVNGTVITTGGTGQLHFSAEGLPPRIEIDEKTGQIQGTVISKGTYVVTVTVRDEFPGEPNVVTARRRWRLLPEMPRPRFLSGQNSEEDDR
jgi:hypothetical protein